jgi:predicted NAD-dependent protein-ADP-ribosyltransferase YbiA (DUF1768 family)
MKKAGRVYVLIATLCVVGCAQPGVHSNNPEDHGQAFSYPAHWWKPVPDAEAASWEILPQAAGPGEVIVSKRNELGLLSNFASTPFVFHGQSYASLEGFWQMMKYPESPAEPRATFPGITWQHTRQEVGQMVGMDAKAAGDLATRNMKAMNIDWVSFEGQRMPYWTQGRAEHYALIVQATREKVRQNPNVREVLLATGDLTLRPDHHQAADSPPAWRYCEILMTIRSELRGEAR